MKNTNKILAIALLAVFFYTLPATRYPLLFAEEQKPESARNEIAVSVNGIGISEAEVQMAVSKIIPRGVFHKGMSEQKRESFRQPAIEAVVERELLCQYAGKLSLEIEKSEIKEIFNKNKDAFKSKKDFYKELERQGLTEDIYKKIIEKEILSRKVLKQEIEEKAKLTDNELEDYYNKNRKKFVSPEKIRVREILINVLPEGTAEEKAERKKNAEEVLSGLKAGEDFAEVAYKHSGDAFRVKGGDLGMVHKGRLLPELEDVAFRLKVGEMSGLIETIYGYHIIRLEDKEPQKQLSFSEAKDSLKKELEVKRHKEFKEALIKSLMEKAEIKIYQ